jgi:hypothetical protein
MPSLLKSLIQQDDHYLQIVGNLWQLDIAAYSKKDAAEIILHKIITENNLIEKLAEAPFETLPVLSYLIAQNGFILSTIFFEQFGEIRVMGERRKMLEKPWESPISVTEWLWYHGVIQMNMLALPGQVEIQEYVYLPDEIRKILSRYFPFNERIVDENELIVRPASPNEVVLVQRGNDLILDLGCLLIASIRTGKPIQNLYSVFQKEKTDFVLRIFEEMSLVQNNEIIHPEEAQNFLQMNRIAALLQMMMSWKNSDQIDDLRETTDLFIDDLVKYSSREIRKSVLSLMQRITSNEWCSFDGFSVSIRKANPNFLRPDGENSPWLIRNTIRNNFNEWASIEGEYLQYLLHYPLYWFGIVDIAFHEKSENESKQKISAFRITRIGRIFLDEMDKKSISEKILKIKNTEKDIPKISIDGKIILTNSTPRLLRYQISRFCEWTKLEITRSVFSITPFSLRQAKENGLSVNSFIGLLKRSIGSGVPQKLLIAIDQWDKVDTQATIFHALLVTVNNPNWINALLSSKDTAPWIEQRLNDNTIIIKSKGEKIIYRALIELGALADKHE